MWGSCPLATPVQMRSWWRFKVDGVGEVRGQGLVALVLESLAVLGQFGQLLGARGEAFIKRGLGLGARPVYSASVIAMS